MNLKPGIGTVMITAILLLFGSAVHAQDKDLDSVKLLNDKAEELVESHPDSAFVLASKARIIAHNSGLRSAEAVSLKYMGLSMLSNHRPDSALTFFFEGLNLFASLDGKEKGYINALNNIADAYTELGSYDRAYKYAHEAAVKAISVNLSKEAGISHNQLGEILFSSGVYAEALKNFYAALQHSRHADYKRGESNALANLGKTYTQIGNYEMGERFLMEAYDSYLKEDGEASTGRVLTNLANLHLMVGDFDRALSEYRQALSIKHANHDDAGIAVALNNIGYTFLTQGLADSALPYFESSLKIKKQINDLKGISSTENNIGAVHLNEGNYALALNHLLQGLSLAQQVNAREYVMESYKLLSELMTARGDKLKALEYHKLFSELQNELYGLQNSNKVAVLQAQYEIEQKENQLLASENSNKQLLLTQEKYRKRFLIAGLIAALAVILVIAYRYTVVQKLVNLLRIRDFQKEQLLKELNHRVKNNLQIVGSILRIQSRRFKDPEALKAILEGHNRIEAMALVHKQLYSGDDSTEIDLAPFIERLVENASIFNGKGQASIAMDIQLNGLRTDAGKSMLLGLIINELVSNAFKHCNSEDPAVGIAMRMDEAHNLELTVKDNGPGLPEKFDIEKQSGFGLKLVKSFVDKLGGVFEFNSGPGAEFKVRIQDFTSKK